MFVPFDFSTPQVTMIKDVSSLQSSLPIGFPEAQTCQLVERMEAQPICFLITIYNHYTQCICLGIFLFKYVLILFFLYHSFLCYLSTSIPKTTYFKSLPRSCSVERKAYVLSVDKYSSSLQFWLTEVGVHMSFSISFTTYSLDQFRSIFKTFIFTLSTNRFFFKTRYEDHYVWVRKIKIDVAILWECSRLTIRAKSHIFLSLKVQRKAVGFLSYQ